MTRLTTATLETATGATADVFAKVKKALVKFPMHLRRSAPTVLTDFRPYSRSTQRSPEANCQTRISKRSSWSSARFRAAITV